MSTMCKRTRVLACLLLAAAVGCEASPLGGDRSQSDRDVTAQKQAALRLQALQGVTPTSANPWLALLPPGTTPDFNYWSSYKRAQWAASGFRPRSSASFAQLVATTESEANNTQATADPVTSFGSAADPAARLSGSIGSATDVDFFSFSLRAGDVISAAVATARPLELRAPNGSVLINSVVDASFLYPEASPLPGDRASDAGAALAYIVNTAGTYALSVGGATGSYQVDLQVFRPKLEAGGTQVVFVDFNGAEVDPAIFDGPPGTRPLSPLSSFLTELGLTAADESAVITAIMNATRESLSADLIARGLNPRVAIDLRNSRDHLDPGSDPNVSRVIVGGTVEQLGIFTIGIAQSIDPGNFGTQESAVVLLDLLAGFDGEPGLLDQIPRAPGASMIALIGTAVGNIVAHEAGHYLGNYHTTNGNTVANIMDEGGDIPNTVGVGPDGTFGSADDLDVDFGLDTYSLDEGFAGTEDTLNTTAFGNSGQAALGRFTVRPSAVCNSNLRIELRDSNLSGSAGITVSASTGDSENVTIQQAAGQPGFFAAQLPVAMGAAAPNNGTLQVQNGATVTLRYQDANSGSGGAATVTTTVAADCQAPAIAGVAAREVTDITAAVLFTTSEPATSRVDFGTSCSALTQSRTGALAISHRLPLSGLSPDTNYFYAVTATDAVGNAARSPAAGSCLSFRSASRTLVLNRDFESGPGGFTPARTSGDLAWHLTTACASALPGHSQPTSYYFGNDATCSFNSDALRNTATLTSPAFAVPGNAITKLRFNYLLETRRNEFADRAVVSISVNGGPFKDVASNREGTLPETGPDAWSSTVIDLFPLLPTGASSANMVVRFSFDDVGSAFEGLAGFYIDDVQVATLGAGTECTGNAQCDDGLFCTGAEACVMGRCTKRRPACDDLIGCTDDSCDETTDRCLNAPDVFVCLDGTLCDGLETCIPGQGCVAPGPFTCATGLVCSNDQNGCIPPCTSSYFIAGFQQNELEGFFQLSGAVTTATVSGNMLANIAGTGSMTSFSIFAGTAPALTLQYRMEVTGLDAGERVLVQYCAASCETASNWITVNTVGGTTALQTYSHTLPAAARTDSLQLRWTSNASSTLSERVRIDDIVVRDPTCSAALPPFNPRLPTISPVTVNVNGATGEVLLSGTASDPDNDIVSVEVLFFGTGIPFFATRAIGISTWSVRIFLGPGEYFATGLVTDGTGGQASSDVSFVVPNPNDIPAGPLFSESFEQNGLSQFTTQGTATVSTTAGDRPGTTGTRGAQIDDTGRIVSRAINASSGSGPLTLEYWLDVARYDSGEAARVAYCIASCTVEANWVVVNTLGGTSGWRSFTHTLPATARTATLQLRWVATASGTLEFASIDDITLR